MAIYMRFLRLLLLLVLLCSAVSSVPAAERVVAVAQDGGAYDYDFSSGYTYPNYTLLSSSTCNTLNAVGYMQFNLTGAPARNVTRAEIRTYTQVKFEDGWPWSIDPTIAVREATSAWNATTLSWANQPSFNATVLDSHTVETVGGMGTPGNPFYEYDGWLSYDITGLYLDWVGGNRSNFGVRFSSDTPFCVNGNIIWYCSSRYGDDPLLRPYLVVTTSTPAVVLVPGGAGVPTDTGGDWLCDDVNGNGRADFADVVLFFNQMTWIADHEPLEAFDYNGNGRIDFADVVWLFNNL